MLITRFCRIILETKSSIIVYFVINDYVWLLCCFTPGETGACVASFRFPFSLIRSIAQWHKHPTLSCFRWCDGRWTTACLGCRAPDCHAGGRGFRSQTGLTLMVLKGLGRMSWLCYGSCKLLDVLVFAERDDKLLAPFPASSLYWLTGNVRNPRTFRKKEKTLLPVLWCGLVSRN